MNDGTITARPSAAEVVRRYHQAWTGGDLDGALACVADDIVCHVPGVVLEERTPCAATWPVSCRV